MKNLLIVIITIFLSCQSSQEKGEKNAQAKLKANDTAARIAPASFLDSIAKRYDLSVAQIRNYTLIDSVYYTGMRTDVGFSGDTFFKSHQGFNIGIVNYDDRRSCMYKFLLVLNANNKNLSGKIIYTNCDHDESADYTALDYKLVSDSIFETIQTSIPAKNKVQKIERVKWKIFSSGEIQSIR